MYFMKSLLKRFYLSKFLIISIFILLLLRAIFYNSIINIAHTPDLGYHIALSDVYRQYPSTIFFWDIKNIITPCIHGVGINSSFLLSPFIYHSLIGKIWFLAEKLGIPYAYQITNLIQSLFGLITIYFIYLLSKQLTKERLIHLTTLIIASNISMNSFIINYLSYDNLTNLFSTLVLYFYIKFIKKNKIRDFVLVFTFFMLGLMTKITFLPFAIIIVLLFIYNFKLKAINILKKTFIYLIAWGNIFYTLFFIVSLSFFMLYFGRNIIQYRTFFPNIGEMDKVSCNVSIKKNLSINNNLVNQEIVQDKQNITNIQKSNNNTTIKKIKNKPMNIIEYFVKWQATVQWSIFDVVSHRSLEKSGLINKGYNLFVILAIISIFWQIYKRNKFIVYLFLIFIGYTTFYFFYMYKSYLDTLLFGPAIQGRYLFPVLAAFIVPASYSILNITKNKYVRLGLFIGISVFFVYFDFFWFLRHYQVWYALPLLDLPK